MVVDALGGWPVLLGVVAVLFVAIGFWRWGQADRTEVPLVGTARAAWRDAAPGTATLTVEIDQDATVYADPDELDALFEELFENAVRYGGDEVTVRLVPTETGFAVADDGPGIPPERREESFEMGVSTRPDRDGIGLALVRSICEGNGWTVSLTESDDGGTRIEVSDVTFREGWDREVSESVSMREATEN